VNELFEPPDGTCPRCGRERFGDEGAVVATEVRLGRCLDLGDTTFTRLLQPTYDNTVRAYEENGWPLPKNGGKDLKLRRLDRLIVDQLTKATDGEGIHFQTVRCPFEEGPQAYPGGMIRTRPTFRSPCETGAALRLAFTR
jgi:hypothetical protein